MHDTSIQDDDSEPRAETLLHPALQSPSKNSAPLSADKNPVKRARQQLVQESEDSRATAHTSPFSDQRIKLSFASEPNWVSFYWLQ